MSTTGVREVSGPSVRALSIRVALATSAIVGVAYLVIAIAVAAIVTGNLTLQIDRDLAQALAHVNRPEPGVSSGSNGFRPPPPDRPFGSPMLVWTVHSDGTVSSFNASDAELPAEYRQVVGPETVSISGVDVRIQGASVGGEHVVVGQTMENLAQTRSTLVVAEIAIGAALLIVVFLGAVAIGQRVAEPIERARQRQLEFTADASHELRTPLAVIEAQTTLALARDREAAWYRTAFGRVDQESKRIRRLLDDMLWLARFDGTGGQPNAEPVDVTVLVAQMVDRFRVVAEARHQALEVRTDEQSAIVTVPPEWLDRLLGVLLDNACRYSPDGGAVAVSVTTEGRRIRLTVDDSGPGIPPAERERILDRFHRATETADGAGLGLAIADAIVRATNGRWHIGDSPAGGASVAVSWQHSIAGGREGRAVEESSAGAPADA
ncbi:MAG: histidine kinase [Chloroflexi bacterium CSP1-4]|nr:MAG: histidine kinase [Chloroflexi bacterium CSP1-4]